ncbi:MAG: hypothetical protein M1480_11845 [Bacteroidetes bacterium]|nr:hypothetical protein [Bacteroidota bacterium]
MKKIITIIVFVSLLPFFFFSCLDSSPSEMIPDINLLNNPSFELNGQPTLTGWDTTASFVNFSRDVPADGGIWSAELGTTDQRFLYPIGPSQLYQEVKLPAGKSIIEFSFWGRLYNSKHDEVDLRLFNSDTSVINIIYIKAASWTNYTLTDTLKTTTADTAEVIFWSGDSIYGLGKVHVDECSLTAR